MACKDCGKHAPLRVCEIHNPPQSKICKDCCISKMNGHGCRWFDLCWK